MSKLICTSNPLTELQKDCSADIKKYEGDHGGIGSEACNDLKPRVLRSVENRPVHDASAFLGWESTRMGHLYLLGELFSRIEERVFDERFKLRSRE
jgi:hypothetical protein